MVRRAADRLGFVHGHANPLILPGTGAQMVAADHDLIKGEALLPGQILEVSDKVGRGPARITPELVHLVAGGFDKNWLPVVLCMLQGGLDDKRVGRAD